MRILLYLVVIVIACVAVYSFFMPWVTGEGSLVKPVDDMTKGIQKVDKTHVTQGITMIGKGVADTLTQAVIPIKLKKTLAGYQIPIYEYKEKAIGPKAYFLYVFPAAAIICVLFSTMGNRRKLFGLLAFLIALGIAFILYSQIGAFNREGLFAKIQACKGIFIMLYSFAAMTVVLFIKLFIPVR